MRISDSIPKQAKPGRQCQKGEELQVGHLCSRGHASHLAISFFSVVICGAFVIASGPYPQVGREQENWEFQLFSHRYHPNSKQK